MKTVDYAGVLAKKLSRMFPDPEMCKLVEDELNRYGRETYER